MLLHLVSHPLLRTRALTWAVAFALALWSCAASAQAASAQLFNGKNLEGWEGETTKVWRVEEGAIVGGTMEGNPQNEFLVWNKPVKNFILKLEYKLTGTEGFVNGGVQFRSKRITDPPNEMIGYQADIGAGYSGCLYDESRRKKMLVTADKDLITNLEKPGDWNQYEVRAEGARIRIFLNGKMTADYAERESGIEQDGFIALQIHGKCKAEIAFRNISLETLPKDLVPTEAEILNRFGDTPNQAAAPTPWPQGKFEVRADDTFVYAGQENLVREQKNGALESQLLMAYSTEKPRFRSMAWEGDTVYEQWRDLNFGDWASQLKAVGATVVIAQFGQVEAFDGKNRLAEFTSAYHRLLDQFSTRTPRLVLLSPMPFEKPLAPLAPNLLERNEDVRAYAQAVRDIAKHRGAIYVDLFTPLSERKVGPRLTDDGLHLNAEGLRVVAKIITEQLGAAASSRETKADLLAAIQEKNRLWFDCWRPANWSFVYGDRVTQLFGKAGGNEPPLQAAFEKHKPIIAAIDARIHALAAGQEAEPIKSLPPPEPPAGEVLTAEAELAGFTLANGYEANLFADEKNGVAKPVQFTWDERGRLWVACSPTYPHTLAGVKPGDFILILEDTDGDGRADKSIRYAEGLTMVQGVELGDGGLYVCDFDQIIHLRDTDGDGKADEKKVVFSGFGIGDTHQLANSITHGPDGSLWFSQGLHAFSRVETPWGLARLDKAGVWRWNSQTQKLEAFFNGGKAGHNCWGVAFDDYGQVFHKSGDRPDGYYTVPGMVDLPNPDEYHPIGSLFYTTPKTTGLEIIGTKGLPQDIQGMVLIPGYFGSVVELHRLLDDGSGFRSEQLPKLLKSSSNAFRPVDASVGPDGAMYLADWFNPVIGHYQASYADPLRDRVHGRIWRISAKGFPRVKQPELASMKAPELLEQLRSPERWTRYQAKRLLFDMEADQVTSAADAWVAKLDPKDKDYERLLLEVTGVFQAHEAPRPELLKKLLSAKDGRVRAYGTRVVGYWADRLPDALTLLSKSAQDAFPRVRLEAVVASSHIPSAAAAETAVQVVDSARDKFIDYALKQTVRSLEKHWKPALAANQLARGGSAAQLAYLKERAGAVEKPPHPGKAVYDALCLNCHQPDGKGLPGVYPPLTQSEWVAGETKPLIRILLHGLMGPITVKGQVYGTANPLPMPPMGLSDQQTADVLSYIRGETFGHNFSTVKPDEVKAVRDADTARTTFWTADDLKK